MGTFGIDIDREVISEKELSALDKIQRRISTIRTLEPSLRFGESFSKGQIPKLIETKLYPRFGEIDNFFKKIKDLQNSAGSLTNYSEKTKEAFSDVYIYSGIVLGGISRAKRNYYSKLPKVK